MVSGDTLSPQSAKKTEMTFETISENGIAIARPRSAGAIPDSFDPIGVSEERDLAIERPLPGVGSPRSSKFSDSGFRTPRQKPLQSSKSTVDGIAAQFSGNLLHDAPSYSGPYPALSHVRQIGAEQIMLDTLPVDRPRSSPELKDAKRPTKVRSWAGSLLSKKAKSRSLSDQADVETSTFESSSDLGLSSDFSLDDINFDEDTTCVIRNPQYTAPRPAMYGLSNFQPGESPYLQNTDVDSLVLDLDAAFNALDGPGDIEGGAGSRYLSTKRRMHSGGATGGFTGPGMHYHRRAESAPEMAPVDRHAFGLNRLGSNLTMADVFEEDEEDGGTERLENDSPELYNASQKDDPSGLGVQIVDANEGCHNSERQSPRQNYFEINDSHPQQSHTVPVTDRRVEPLFVSLPSEHTRSIDIVDAVEEPHFSFMTKSSDESTATPTLANDLLGCGLPDTLTEYSFPRPVQYLDAPESQSSVSSPDFADTSFDVPRLHTATSSITDRTTLSSRRIGGTGQGSTYSTEDVPSLTSSASTMISSHPPRFTSNAETRSSGERSMSFSAAVPRRTRPVSAGKRSSLASLSRLVGGSYGEKSKLSIESRAQSDDSDKPEKNKRSRMSRLMRFWKAKEKLVAS